MPAGLPGRLPVEAVNFHVWQPCNMGCKFCFARFSDVRAGVLPKGHLPEAEAVRVVELLAQAGFRKITFAGGEPFLCPWLPRLVETAARSAMVTSVVTNGTRPDSVRKVAGLLDWLVVSIDSLSPDTLLATGRATGTRVLSTADYTLVCRTAKDLGMSLKVNTVVSRTNWRENLGWFIAVVLPLRWKIMQMLPIDGQNDGWSGVLSVTPEQFGAFVARNQQDLPESVKVISEDNSAMTGSYAMVDPAGRFFDNTSGCYVYSDSVLTHGVGAALSQVTIESDKFVARGGLYDWRGVARSGI